MTRTRSFSAGIVLIHGGAGAKKPSRAQLACLADALLIGGQHIHCNGSALDAVEAMIRHLEASGLFNAGAGSRTQLDGVQRMDAALMEGGSLHAGGIACVEDLRFPISAARLVMDRTKHVLLVGEHARRFVHSLSPDEVAHPSNTLRARSKSMRGFPPTHVAGTRTSLPSEGCETVGAVALDHRGHVAAGTSTGGVARMLPGRVGDSPIIGAGLYADDTAGAVSMTGIGEGIMRLSMAKTISLSMQRGKTPAIAARTALKDLRVRLRGQAGCLVLAPRGDFAIYHTTPWMSAGYWNGQGSPIVRPSWRRVVVHKPAIR